jgi:hypothetical protein
VNKIFSGYVIYRNAIDIVFQLETPDSQHAKVQDTNKYVMQRMVDPGGG